MKQTFWLDKWEGKAKDGFFVRNPLKEFMEKCDKAGLKVVGIKYDGTYNLELIMETKTCNCGDETPLQTGICETCKMLDEAGMRKKG
jgi:hypothetical protein